MIKELIVSCAKSAACRAKGIEYVANGAIALIGAYGLDRIRPCLLDSNCRDQLVAAIVDGSGNVGKMLTTASVRPGPGQGIEPPGDCRPDYLAEMSELVNRYCKSVKNSCLVTDKLPRLQEKIEGNGLCLRARIKRESECFRGGDRNHRDQIAETKNRISNCYRLLARAQ